MQPIVSDIFTTPAGHWDGWRGMVRYASATSRVAASEPGGRWAMRSYINENFPHVVGKSSAVMLWLIDMLGDSVEGLRGKEKFWIS